MKPGYKQTEVGVIPEDWEVGSLKQAFPHLDAGVSVNSDDSESSDYYILKTSAVRNGRVNIKEAKPVIRSDYARLKCPVKKGSIIISRMNTPAMVGECGFSTIDAPNTFLPDRLWQIEPSSPDYDFQWLNYLLNTEKYSAAIRATATGTSNSMKNIAKERLLEISIPKPPCPEQQRIAEALSDMDELISSLEKLIEKKKAIKKGAMQELLTGKRRLPGFSGEWTVRTISSLGKFISGNGFPLEFQGHQVGKYPFYKVSDFNNIGNELYLKRANNYISSEIAEKLKCSIIPKDSIVFAKIGAAIFLERKKLTTVECCIDNNTMSFQAYDSISPHFLWYIFQTVRFGDLVEVTALPSLSGNAIGAISKPFPPTKREQEEIASVLLDLDHEIADISKKLDKACHIRLGMMQQLLTGKLRLNVEIGDECR